MSIRLYVGNLPKELERQELEAVFSDYDDSVSTKLITDRKTGKCRGFAFVTVKDDEQAEQLIEKYNGYMLKESALKVEKAQPRAKEKEESSTPGGSKRKSSNTKGSSRKGSSSSTEASQPDPRWANELEKLKQMLAAQTTNS
ncbi:MAG: RNA-binding protein [Leptolyngbyaceae bacterium]|nr:RNA-binding protein [Leptolyngbyaceae bacterium]